MFIKSKHGFIRNYSIDESYNVCRSCKFSKVITSSQGDHVICELDNKEDWQGKNKDNECNVYKKAFCWIIK